MQGLWVMCSKSLTPGRHREGRQGFEPNTPLLTMSCFSPAKDCSTELAFRTCLFAAAFSPRKRSSKSLTASPWEGWEKKRQDTNVLTELGAPGPVTAPDRLCLRRCPEGSVGLVNQSLPIKIQNCSFFWGGGVISTLYPG